MLNNQILKPFLKWPGGKTRHLEKISNIIKHISLSKSNYYEPFVGGGSIFFNLKPNFAVINDLNSELINAYEVIKFYPNELINKLEEHKSKFKTDQSGYYYQIRSMDRSDDFLSVSNIDRAARLIFLNKTCYNGIYRVNKKGHFNTPIGRYKDPKIYDHSNILNISKYLSENKVKILNKDYKEILKDCKKGDLIYFDPPYDYDEKSIFLGYGEKIFNKEDLKVLRDIALELIGKGCYVILSNNYTRLVKELFIDPFDTSQLHFKSIVFDVKRLVNSKVELRAHPVQEVLLYGSNFPTS